ncbi:DUF695 domain-containing protein [Sulfurimonas aquatica]|uniref:DUF695 domain-containing protein n=1 Tax=Sulfurimonas aquatica TaxID=2672570 RepID=A0A975GCR0_9BACT|nr:DUF695 domain-containing protein [Sulfurimonas aquatica]QSZ41885.1 DUF695 domain-containing protein [Sulfurimonas aquatica]
MREFFQRLEDGSLVSIEVDMNAFGYSKSYPWLFSVFIKFDASDENAPQFEEFLETKESLIILLEHEEKAKYVGSRVVDGWSELYFYAKDSKSLDAQVSSVLTPSNYVYESSVVKDGRWDFHHKNLTPTELEECHIQSEKIIFLLEEEGDELEVPRIVEHYVSFDVPTQKNRFINTLDLEGFTFKDDISSEEFENGVALVKEHGVRSEDVKVVVEALFEKVKECQGYYEGWSTTLADKIN